MQPSTTAEGFEYIRELVRARAGVLLEESKSYLAESRLIPVMRDEGCASLDDLARRLRAHGSIELHRRVVEAMVTTETSFFRDVHPFEALKRVVLPELIAARAGARALAVWDGACSSGQEAYSIAMLLAEQATALAGWSVRLLASDLSDAMLERVRQGRYGQLEVNRGLPAVLFARYFEKDGLGWRVKEPIRAMLDVRMLNLVQAWPALPSFDVVFLRNVLIYFDLDTRREVLGKVRRILRPDGYLFLGSAETTTNIDDTFERVAIGKTACYRLRVR
jgi:chemotaxis protein methyltransferase CheR